MEPSTEPSPARTYVIRRSPHLGYGFVAGYESPTMVKVVEPNGPSYRRLLPGDVIMAVNGIEVERESREKIIKMIQLCNDQIEIKVRQPTYQELVRAKNLAEPKFYTLNEQTADKIDSSNRLPLNSSMHRLVTSIAHQQPNQTIMDQQQHQNKLRSLSTPKSATQQSPLFLNGDSHNRPVQIDTTPDLVLRRNDRYNNNLVNQHQPHHHNNHNYNSKHNIENSPSINNISNRTRTLGRNSTAYGRHSPLPQRCKSSLDKKQPGDDHNDQPLLKRSNTMRPIRPSPKVLEIFEVVIKIFFEDGHTRVLNYDSNTTVGTILKSLNTRLLGDSPNVERIKQYFGLALTVGISPESGERDQTPKRKLLHVLDENDSIMKIRQLPYAPKLRLLYRMIYAPDNICTLYEQSKIAFDYYYKQSCNDLKLERFNPELDQATALKLSALHLLEYVHSNHAKSLKDLRDPKLCVKLIKKSPGIEYFIPISMRESLSDKRGKKNIANLKKLKTRLIEQLRKNFQEFDLEPPKARSTTNLNEYSASSFHELCLPESQNSPSDHIKLLLLKSLSQLPCRANSKRTVDASASAAEQDTGGDRSSSSESVPRGSDSSPLIKHDKTNLNGLYYRDNRLLSNCDSVSNLPQISSICSLGSSVRPGSMAEHNLNRPEAPGTPSIESVSTITLNTQSSPSPQQHLYQNHLHASHWPTDRAVPVDLGPSPRPRQLVTLRPVDYNAMGAVYWKRDKGQLQHRPIDELLRNVVLPPPPPMATMFDLPYQTINHRRPLVGPSLTPVLSDRDLECLKVPPPPRLFD